MIKTIIFKEGYMDVIELSGRKFGKLTVIKRYAKRGNTGQILWECVCSCGKEHTTSGECLRSGKSKSCGCNRFTPPNKETNRVLAIWKQLYKSTIIKRSKKFGYETDIDFDLFRTISSRKCFYCGIEPTNFATDRFNTKTNGRKTSDTVVRYNGLDRLDSSLGYLKNNVVPCCKYCNTAKNIMLPMEFMQFIKRVYEYNFIGIEKEPEYVEIARKRILQNAGIFDNLTERCGGNTYKGA